MGNNRSIEDIAYLIKRAEENGENKPIILLGAGASASAGIPLAEKIVEDILLKHKEKPSIKRLTEDDRRNYYKLMSALSAQERRNVFAEYINNEDVKLNVTHIYLAQMLKEGYVDYILTVNFDDLLLKASALFNFIPPVYDVSVINDFTTTNFLAKSVIYLHGQHHGQWLLNAEGELSKISKTIPKIFDRICHNRTWIVVGYSGDDELINEIAKIGSFENELYWIGYKENSISEIVHEKLFTNQLLNAYHIKGHDSDSFFLKLHSELKLKTPEIFNKPFSFLHNMMNQVTDVLVDEKNQHKDLFKSVKERMAISRKQVEEAIQTIENKDDENELIQIIIEKTIKKDFSEEQAFEFEKKIKKQQYYSANESLSIYYLEWANSLYDFASLKKDESIIKESFQKYKKASELNPKNENLYFDWGLVLYKEAFKNDDKNLYLESSDKFQRMIAIDPSEAGAYNNLGLCLFQLAKQDKSKELFEQSFKQFQMAINLDPFDDFPYNNWGLSLYNLAFQQRDKILYEQSFQKFKDAANLNQKSYNIFYNWANALHGLAEQEKDENLFLESFDKFQMANNLNSENCDVFYDWGNALNNLAFHLKSKKRFLESFEKYHIATKLNPNFGNAYSNWGVAIMNYSKQENIGSLFLEANDKFQIAFDLKENVDQKSLFLNWSASLLFYSRFLTGEKKIEIINLAKEKATFCYLNFKKSYNLSCSNALLENKVDAFKYLKQALENNEITIQHVKEDDDWNSFRDDEDFIKLLESYED